MKTELTMFDQLEKLEDIACTYRTIQTSVINVYTDDIDYCKDLDVALYNLNNQLQETINNLRAIYSQSQE